MKRTFEIHCKVCGTMLRRFAIPPTECPDCGDNQAIVLPWKPQDARITQVEMHDESFDIIEAHQNDPPIDCPPKLPGKEFA